MAAIAATTAVTSPAYSGLVNPHPVATQFSSSFSPAPSSSIHVPPTVTGEILYAQICNGFDSVIVCGYESLLPPLPSATLDKLFTHMFLCHQAV